MGWLDLRGRCPKFHLANLPTRVPLSLLNNAKAPVGMTDFKIKRIFWSIGNFYRYRLQILGILSGKHFGWNGRHYTQGLGPRLQMSCALNKTESKKDDEPFV